MKGQMKTTTVHIKSALPLFGAAALVILCALILPVYKLWAIIVTAAIAAGGWFLLTKKFPGRDETTVEEILTGDKQLDEQIKQSREILARFRATAEKAGDETVKANITRIADAAEGIVDEVIADKGDRSDAYTFFSYYLPTLDQLNTYYTDFATTVKGENAETSKRRIEGCLGMVAESFEKFLNKLYHNEAVSIKASVEVLKTMLRADGLASKESTGSYVSAGADTVIDLITANLKSEAEMEQKLTSAGTNE